MGVSSLRCRTPRSPLRLLYVVDVRVFVPAFRGMEQFEVKISSGRESRACRCSAALGPQISPAIGKYFEFFRAVVSVLVCSRVQSVDGVCQNRSCRSEEKAVASGGR